MNDLDLFAFWLLLTTAEDTFCGKYPITTACGPQVVLWCAGRWRFRVKLGPRLVIQPRNSHTDQRGCPLVDCEEFTAYQKNDFAAVYVHRDTGPICSIAILQGKFRTRILCKEPIFARSSILGCCHSKAKPSNTILLLKNC